MRTAILLSAILLLVPLADLSAQGSPTIEPGQRVRITAPDSGISSQVRVIRVVNADNIELESGLRLPLAAVTRIEVRRERSHWVRGTLIGGFLGLLVGGAILAADDTCRNDTGGDFCLPPGILAPPIGLLGGLFIGGAAGSQFRFERWEDIPGNRITVGFAPLRKGRTAIGVSIKF